MCRWLKDFVHNCVVHPMMPFLPVKVANWLHDKNANWAFGVGRLDELALEDKKKPIDKQLAQLTGRKILMFIDEALKKNPVVERQDYPKDFDSDSPPMP